jgi:hypothetical protein
LRTFLLIRLRCFVCEGAHFTANGFLVKREMQVLQNNYN